MQEQTIIKILLFVGSLCLLVFILSPFAWMIWISLNKDLQFLDTGNWHLTFQNYYDVITDPSLHFRDYLYNSLVVSVITSLIVTVIASMAGYAVSRMQFPGRIAIPLLILAMSMFPQISIVGYLFNLFTGLGWINHRVALILPYTAWTVPIALWIMMNQFNQIPIELDKAALVDGASWFKTLRKVIVPSALPGIFSSFLLVFIACFNEFLFARMLTTDFTAQTLPVGIAMFEGIHGEIPWGHLMAASVIASLPLVILTLLLQWYIVKRLKRNVKGKVPSTKDW